MNRKKQYINPSDDPSLKVLKCYQYSCNSFEEAREDSEELMQYAAANLQWSDEQISEAEEYKKPYLTYNIIIPILMAMQGNEQIARRRARIKPNFIQQSDISDIIQARFNAIVDEQELEDLLQIAFFDALITKVGGWIQRDFVINDEGYLDFKYSIAKNLNVHPDPEFLQTDTELKNIRWIIKETWMSLNNLISKYELGYIPEKGESKYWWHKLSDVIQKFKDKFYTSQGEHVNKQNDTYKVLEMQERISEEAWICWDGEILLKLNNEDYLKAKEFNKSIEKIRPTEDFKIHITTIVPYFKNMVVYNKDSKIPSKNFDLFPMFSFRFNVQSSEGTSFIHLLKDIQDDINKGKSQWRDLITQLASSARVVKGREQEAVKQLKERGNEPNQVIWLKGVNSEVKNLGPGQIPPDLPGQIESSFVFAERTSMVTPTIKGQTERSGESGILFQKKLESASAAINPYFKNLSLLRKFIAKDFVDNFAMVYSEENRPIMIKRPKNFRDQVFINLNYAGNILNDVSNASLYVELDEGEDNKTMREENFNQLLGLSQLIAQINPAYVDVVTLLESAPVTGVDNFIKHIQSVQQNEAQIAGEQTDIETTKKQLENAKLAKDIEVEDDKIKLEAIKLAIDKSNKENISQKKEGI